MAESKIQQLIDWVELRMELQHTQIKELEDIIAKGGATQLGSQLVEAAVVLRAFADIRHQALYFRDLPEEK